MTGSDALTKGAAGGICPGFGLPPVPAAESGPVDPSPAADSGMQGLRGAFPDPTVGGISMQPCSVPSGPALVSDAG